MRNRTLVGVAMVLGGAAAAACSSSPAGTTIIVLPGGPSTADGSAPAPSTTATSTSAPGTDSGPPAMTGGDGGTAAATGLPCDVATLLSSKCTFCHSDPPVAGSLAGLVTLADLKATSHEDPTKNEAQLSVARMQSSTAPMPPGAAADPTDATTLQNWINAGYPAGSCGGTDAGTGTDGGSHPADSGAPAGGDAGGATGVPCNVATVLAANCTGCHSDPPVPSALSGLVTYADLMATSKEDATKNEAQLSLSRMQNTAMPMPPSGVPSAADVATIQAWVTAGTPMGASCGGDSGTVMMAPFSVFTGEAPYALGQTSNGNHHAGEDCVGCHQSQGGEAPQFTLAGTVVDATGAGVGGAEVRLVDANGMAFSVYSDNSGNSGSAGNFSSRTAWVAPAHVGVRNATNTQDMLVTISQSQGGCNSCHCTGGGACVTPEVHLP